MRLRDHWDTVLQPMLVLMLSTAALPQIAALIDSSSLAQRRGQCFRLHPVAEHMALPHSLTCLWPMTMC